MRRGSTDGGRGRGGSLGPGSHVWLVASLALETGIDPEPWLGRDVVESESFLRVLIECHNFRVKEAERKSKRKR